MFCLGNKYILPLLFVQITKWIKTSPLLNFTVFAVRLSVHSSFSLNHYSLLTENIHSCIAKSNICTLCFLTLQPRAWETNKWAQVCTFKTADISSAFLANCCSYRPGVDKMMTISLFDMKWDCQISLP